MSGPRRVAWKLSGGSSLLWRRWNDEYVVHNAGSGDTHLLDLLAGEVLKQLEASSADAQELTQRVAAAVELPADVVLVQHIERLLADFDQLGLIDPDEG